MQLPDFSNIRVLVVGDVMLDKYWHGKTQRISPEAPVPVVNVGEHQCVPGGAANVALNVAALGAKPTLLGLMGDDEAANLLEAQLHSANIETALIRTDYPTITKLRIMSQHQQLLRLDFETPYPATCLPALQEAFEQLVKKTDIIIFSDYAKGVFADAKAMLQVAKRYQVPVFVDPKVKDIAYYAGATLVTPNLKEFEAFVGPVADETDLVNKGMALAAANGFEHLLVTRGEAGMSLLHQSAEPFHCPTRAREVFDVTGAGDTVIATLATAYAAGLDLNSSVKLANIAAGIVVGKMGTATATRAELLHELLTEQHEKCLPDVASLLALIEWEKSRGETIVMTNGCFDILHAGHIQYLTQAKQLGDKLIIAVNSDASVKRLKGETRPINTLEDRMTLLAALSVVDYVIAFDEDTPKNLIEAVMPDILVKGGDYEVHQIAGAQAVLDNGGQVKILPFKPGCSTTRLIDKMKEV